MTMLSDQLDQEERVQTVAEFATIVGLPPLEAIVQEGRDRAARFILRFADGESVELGGINILWSKTEFRKRILLALSADIRFVKDEDWGKLITNLIVNGITVDEAQDERFQDAVADWLQNHARHAHKSDRDGAIAMREPFIEDGRLHVYVDAFLRYVRRDLSEPVKRPDVIRALKDLGYRQKTLNYYKTSNDRSTASYYVMVDAPDVDDTGE